jgi:O-acetyl-ADP-ribose deacetylase (regulator of RNase III)
MPGDTHCGPSDIGPDDDELLPATLFLIDQSTRLVNEWKNAFSVFPEVEVVSGDYFQKQADAIVSPANSFGIMDGGLDLAIRDQLGYSVQNRLQKVIVERYHGELPIGCAEIIETKDSRWKYLIAAPTMRVPESVSSTINAFLAFRAILLAAKNLNRRHGKREIDSLVCCGLATGVGGMPASRCATQMRIAYKTMLEPPLIRRFDSIHQLHSSLMNS